MKFIIILVFGALATFFTFALMAGLVSLKIEDDGTISCWTPLYEPNKSICTCWFAAAEGQTQKMNNGIGCNVVAFDGINKNTLPQCKAEDVFSFSANKFINKEK
ncbi:hypothetical protein [Thalassomonas actiniarum]|uniref:Uncharacterized protein n=1 Tax=Thalassomonas actiniarum TaxID=485447 RepID=A0AAE9YLZ5_9GAMM|nr:hypothetical protein [Thalassomonas actiniarum]WDD97441.1 hypothetical protein SG35_019245 [Thalassomonas actiniarum]